MPKRSNKQVANILTLSLTDNLFLEGKDDKDNPLPVLETKISIATEGHATHRFR
jgi:hypothetical protein